MTEMALLNDLLLTQKALRNNYQIRSCWFSSYRKPFRNSLEVSKTLYSMVNILKLYSRSSQQAIRVKTCLRRSKCALQFPKHLKVRSLHTVRYCCSSSFTPPTIKAANCFASSRRYHLGRPKAYGQAYRSNDRKAGERQNVGSH